MARVTVPDDNQDQVLLRSRRRCCICFGLDGDLRMKQGQIAHLDHNNANPDPDNLAFLCLLHHDQYDGKTSQSKALRESEVKQFRRELYDRIAAGLPIESNPQHPEPNPHPNMRQWVDIEEWRSTPWIPEGNDQELRLHIQFNVVNPTDKPLTLHGVSVSIGEQQIKVSRKNFITPKKWSPIVMSIKITEEQFTKWSEDKLVFPVCGHVTYEDVLDKVRTQPFSGMIACSKKNGVVFIPPYGSGLYITDPQEKNDDREAVADRERKIAREEIGRVLQQLAQCEHEAYNGSNALDYEKLLEQIQQVKETIHSIASRYLDTSFESRFLAVNVLDVQLDNATKMHFISRAQGSFWTMYQQIKGWRACLVDVLRELGR